ncbi:MAG: hypothetical protein KDD44_14500, partial [Bdellovibrionales bacterium]|nr:hypothetical protein [Bdellovibrionales bacterium]
MLSFFAGVGLSADGSFASFASSSNILGTNPDQTIDIFAVNTSDPSSLRQITAVAVGFETPQTFVTRDGDVYLIAAENYGGLNPGGLQQLFGYSWADDQLRQITSNTLLNGAFLALSSDDSYLTYINTVDLVGENPNYRFQSYRFDLQSQTFEQTTNFTSNIAGAGGFVAGNGNRFFLYSSSDLTGENSDGSTELFSVTISGASRILDVEVGGGTTGGIEINIDAARQAALSIGGLTISSQVEARGAIQSLKRDMGNLELLSADIGSGINRLTLAAGNASLMSEELQAAASRIREVDVAEEAAELIKNSILQNAAAALLAQANQQP